MDLCRNVSVAGGEYHQPEQANLDDLFSTHNTEVDVSLEWLSIFVEDCLTSSGNCLPPPPTATATATATHVEVKPQVSPTDPQPTNMSKALHLLQKQKPSPSLHKLGKPRSKRKKRTTKPMNKSHLTSWTKGLNPRNQNQQLMSSSDTLLLQQAYWLADSELILPEETDNNGEQARVDVEDGIGNGNGQGQGRRCSHCLSQRTPQWRAGPLGPKTLCNACGVRYKSGRLLPEYRPAKSPTFVSNLHSNSHKKVLEMRHMGLPPIM